MEFKNINSNRQWHDWFNRRRDQLKWRLEQAQNTEWNWPSTRARVAVDRIEREIEELDAEEFIVPGFDSDHTESCAFEGARL